VRKKIFSKDVMEVYRRLFERFGPQGWWPCERAGARGGGRLEIIIGAILTQNTAWNNVEKAIANLRGSGVVSSVRALGAIGSKELSRLIRPSGYYNVKAGRLKNFICFLKRKYGSSLDRLSRLKTDMLRDELLSINGIGPETCDSILLYAFKRPVFVVDAYTRRIFSRHGSFSKDASYDDMQRFFMRAIPASSKLYNEYHALIVRLGKEFCRTNPDCDGCPLWR